VNLFALVMLCKKIPREFPGESLCEGQHLPLMLFTVTALLSATTRWVLILLVAIVLTTTLLTTALLARMLPAVTLLLAALMLVLAAMLLALLLIHKNLLSENVSHRGNMLDTPSVPNFRRFARGLCMHNNLPLRRLMPAKTPPPTGSDARCSQEKPRRHDRRGFATELATDPMMGTLTL
jgi:hypothetical protein